MAAHVRTFGIWTVDGAGGVQFSPTFGPFPGWQAIRLGVGADRQTRLLWRHTTGLISVWTLNAAGQVVASSVYGPFDGWTASDMAIGSDGLIHLAWTHTTGALRLWQTPANADQIWSAVSYGPYAGWTPAGLALDKNLSRRILWRNGGTIGLWSEANPGYPIIDGVYGPFADWTPINLSAGTPDQSVRLLWRHSGGGVGVWRVMPGGSVDKRVLGPYAGWQALAIAVPNTSPDFGDVYPRILWRHTTGMIALWKTSESVNSYKGLTFGPYAGWTAIDLAVGPE